ncbi:DEAD-box ATP-dependent RNA helicase 52C-like [Andrographis paniculata]|uniref:DEAD-box ATP-dependent RNA helicase 52C-like n=1 Tax=Andrographis paniculata TaxID=175694 RepID=UPI0021E85A72|nr:DEAD-box ATP-dependent RNA helicase 52C-like [Andrographis paniculata]
MSQRQWFNDSTSTAPARRGRPHYVPPRSRQQPNITVTVPTARTPTWRRRHVVVGGSPYRQMSEDFDTPRTPEELVDALSEQVREVKLESPMADSVDAAVEVTGVDIPPPVASFAEMRFFAEALSENIRRCKYVTPTPIQRHAIPVAMAGRDLMACAQTGSGKTAAFCFPIINAIMAGKQIGIEEHCGYSGARVMEACPMALILAPTRELACQIHEEAKKFAHQTGIKVMVAYGGTPIVYQLRNLEKGVDILVATPGRLIDMIERSKVSLRNVRYLALDEADRMLDMGFEPQIRKIVQEMEMPPCGERQTLLFSATFPAEIQRLASDFLSNHIFLAAGKVGSSTDLILQRVEFVSDMDKRGHLLNLLYSQRAKVDNAKDALTLVFVETKKGADSLEGWLSRKGFPSAAIHGDKAQMERERSLKSFRSGRTPILVATDVAARGLDIPHVAHVVNFDLPRSVDDYVHRIGRTGRAGKSGLATAFFSEKNAPIAKALVELMQGANQEIPEWLREYADTSPRSAYGRPSHHSRNKWENQRGSYQDYSNSDDYSSQFTDNPLATPAYTVDDYASSPFSAAQSSPHIADYNAPAATDPFNSDSYSNGYSYGSVVPTGWD